MPPVTVSYSLDGPTGSLFQIAPLTGSLASVPAGASPATDSKLFICEGRGCGVCFQSGACGGGYTGCSDYETCQQHYPDLPNAVWEWQESYTENAYYKVIDVSALTKADSVMLTNTWNYQTNGSYDWLIGPVDIDVTVLGNGDSRFVITQTRPGFRPLDARDPAAPCTTLDSGGKDDCHAAFKVQLVNANVGPMVVWSQSGSEDRIRSRVGSPLPAKQKMFSQDQASRPYTPHLPTGRNSPRFRPGNALVDTTQTDLLTTFTFNLSLPSAAPAWLTGTSTDYSLNPSDDGNAPDYLFEAGMNPAPMATPTNGGLTIATAQPVDPMTTTTAVVTSRDFGGRAQLRVAAQIQGMTFYADVVSDPMDSGFDPANIADLSQLQDVTPPGATCGADFARQPFASLPVDQDCNGIADSWEDRNSPQTDASGNPVKDANGNILHLPIDWDQEPGYTPTSPEGDGWSVHDEYRGFHYLADDGVTVKWTSTDPLKKFDIFFWDSGFSPRTKGDAKNFAPNPSIFTQALRQILCLQGSYSEMGANTEFAAYPAGQTVGAPNVTNPVAANTMKGYNYCGGGSGGGTNEYDPSKGPGSDPNPLKFWYRRVNAQQAHARDFAVPQRGAGWFNRNSVTSPDTQGNHTVVIYFYEPSAGSGNSLTLAGTINNLGSCHDCTDPNLARIGIDWVNITKQAQAAAGKHVATMTPATWLAQTVAHETGHWFQQNHAQRQSCCTLNPDGKASNLNWQTYTTQSNGWVLVGIGLYPNGSRQIPPTDELACGSRPGPQQNPITWVKNLPGAPNMPVYSLSAPQLAPGQGFIVNNLQYELMDWTPNTTLADPTQWHFDPSDLNALCAMNPCPKPGPTLCSY